MKPGRELDALVAENVMGWKRVRWMDWKQKIADETRTSLTYSWHDANGDMTENAEDMDDYYNPTYAWSPSTDIAAAWEVVERLALTFEMGWLPTDKGFSWDASFGEKRGSEEGTTTYADTAPHAICLAALKACG